MCLSAPQGNPGPARLQYQARKDLDGERQCFKMPHAEGFLFPANIYLYAGLVIKILFLAPDTEPEH